MYSFDEVQEIRTVLYNVNQEKNRMVSVHRLFTVSDIIRVRRSINNSYGPIALGHPVLADGCALSTHASEFCSPQRQPCTLYDMRVRRPAQLWPPPPTLGTQLSSPTAKYGHGRPKNTYQALRQSHIILKRGMMRYRPRDDI